MNTNFSVKTFDELMAMRVLTGVTRIAEHHLANKLNNINSSHSWLVSKFTYNDFLKLITYFQTMGFVVESRHNNPQGVELSKADLSENIAASFNAYRVEHQVVHTLLNITVDGNQLTVTSYQTLAEDNYYPIIEGLIKSRICEKPIKLRYICGFDSDGNAITDTREIVADQNRPIDEFYPSIDGGITKLAKDFAESSNNLLFMMSEPGTGKSTLIRELCRVYRDRPLIQFTGEKTIKHPSFDVVLAKLAPNAICIIEDADTLVAKRADDNTTMSMLLNEIDGIANKGVKFIISTNLPNRKHVDEALFRPGRCFATLEFNKLSKEQATIVADKMELNSAAYARIEAAGAVTLAELLATGGDPKAKEQSIGF